MVNTYSIRNSLQGDLTDFIRSAGFSCVHLEELVREFVGLLAAYREEGSPLFPEVFIVSSEGDLAVLAPASLQVKVGTLALRGESAETVLKNCAALAVRGWAIFVVKDNQQLHYGLFRSILHSFATSAEEAMRDVGSGVPIMLARNRGHLSVELLVATGERFTASLTTMPPQPSTIESAVSKFVDSAASQLIDDSFKAYLQRLIVSNLQHCHGTLLATVKRDAEKDTIQSGVWPASRLDFAELRKGAIKTGTADALADLQAAEALLAGMINSDGVVLFDEAGSVLAYRVFLTADEIERANVPQHGGGRRRAFELMRLRLHKIFGAVLFRSQDGETKCERES